MSGFIHISHETPAWQKALRAGGALAVLGGLAWWVLSDEGLPVAPVDDAPALPFVKATPLPAPPPVATTAQDEAADDAPAASDPRMAAAAEDDDLDYATRNRSIDLRRLTLQRPETARSFLSEVLLTPTPGAGYVVAEVLPESRYERMGLRPGDVVYTLDTPGAPVVDETSMVALMQQTELHLEVYRQGTLTRLHTSLAQVENGDAVPAP